MWIFKGTQSIMTNEDQRFDCLQWAQEMNAQYDNFILYWGHVYRDINAIFW